MNAFKWIGRIEGFSFLFLLLVAMPLKYIWEEPLMVKYAGWAHGVFFMGYLGAALYVFFAYKWKFTKLLLAAIAGFIPLGPWLFEKKLIGK
ncbi:MAG: integral membrane protein [Salibacteraceae bacterium]|jgi:integral membrane protein|tara:strand:+ start:2893 stop:3165 length:273 start_codon:yes stop_codon:yes gene_type:complete